MWSNVPPSFGVSSRPRQFTLFVMAWWRLYERSHSSSNESTPFWFDFLPELCSLQSASSCTRLWSWLRTACCTNSGRSSVCGQWRLLAPVSDVEAELPKSVQAHWIDSNLHERTLRVTLNRCKWRQRTRAQRRWRSRVVNERNRVRTCVRSRVRMRARSRVRVSAKMWSWSTGSEDCNAMRWQLECFVITPYFVCVVETPRVLKQGVHKLHCWFTEPDVKLLTPEPY